jgi:hypothetical protein
MLAERFALALPSPPPIAGTLAIWRVVRHALALSRKHGVHFDLWSGGPVWYPPMRGSHTVAAARLALAAGATDITVRMGCAGDRWIGAVISDAGHSRPHAPMWRELLAWTANVPQGDEICADLLEPEAFVSRVRATTVVHPLPLGLLALVGLTPGQLAASDTPDGARTTLGTVDARLLAAESRLIDGGVPFRRVAASEGALAYDGHGAVDSFVRKASKQLETVAVTALPSNGALVRAVRSGPHENVTLVIVSKIEEVVSVEPARGGFVDEQGHAVSGPIKIEPGGVRILRGATPKKSKPPRAKPTAKHSTTSKKARTSARRRRTPGETS